ncbi:MAG: lipid-A-disaccharide synthase [Alphaproteobacteria bacterium]
MARRIMVVAGEPSGDMLGGRLMAELTALSGGAVEFVGVGGEAMRAQGLESLFPIEELSVMGFAEVVPSLPRLWRRIRETVALALELRPDALVTIDTPAFSLRVAKRLAGAGIPLVHYVAPSVWAWRPGRARAIARFLDHLLALMPFEPPYFEKVGLPCSYVGHPAIEFGADRGDGPGFRARHRVPGEARLLLLLPGSRRTETARHLPLFERTLSRLRGRFGELRAVIPTVSAVADEVAATTARWRPAPLVVRGEAERWDAFAAADGALAVSGTVSLELALARVPTVVTYKTGILTSLVAGLLVRTKYVSPPNLILDRAVIPELLLAQARPQRLAEAVSQILVDREARAAQTRAADEVAAKLGVGGEPPSRRAARVVLEVIARGPRRPEHAP